MNNYKMNRPTERLTNKTPTGTNTTNACTDNAIKKYEIPYKIMHRFDRFRKVPKTEAEKNMPVL